jgi:hypothetical protein
VKQKREEMKVRGGGEKITVKKQTSAPNRGGFTLDFRCEQSVGGVISEQESKKGKQIKGLLPTTKPY